MSAQGKIVTDRRIYKEEIIACYHCPNCLFRAWVDGRYYRQVCRETKRTDIELDGTPDWCPLPKKPEETE